MTFKEAASKLLSCGLMTKKDEDRTEVSEAIAWAIWALMEQARHEYIGDPAMELNAEDYTRETFEAGDKVVLISHGDCEDIYYEPEIGTVGIVQTAGNDNCFVRWPDRSTEAGRDGRDDYWSIENYKLKKIP